MDKQDDDGFILSESRAIARYLEEKYPNQGTQLFPKDFEKRALVDQATWAEASYYSRFGGTLTFEILNKKCVIKALVLLSILIHVFFFQISKILQFQVRYHRNRECQEKTICNSRYLREDPL